MPDELDPLPLADVLAIVEARRLRRQRLALRGALGAGAAIVTAAGVRAASTDGSPTANTPTTAASVDASTTTTTPELDGLDLPEWQVQAAQRFYDELGFAYADAERLATLWETDPYVPKIVVGLAPGGEALADATADDALAFRATVLEAFSGSGLAYEDAAELAADWGFEPYDAKLIAGAQRLAGES